ncbi:MAG: hypothetical protein ACF8XB_06245 [Planctomycetota bacterium JB042]
MRHFVAKDKCKVKGGKITLCDGAAWLCDEGHLDRSIAADGRAKPGAADAIFTRGIAIGGKDSDFMMTFCPVCGAKHQREERAKKGKG